MNSLLSCIILKDDDAEEVRSCARYFSEVPQKADSKGLIQCHSCFGYKQAILVGGGTDGASVNISDQNGMKGTMQRALYHGFFWSWCYSHRLELACKDALCSQLFQDLLEMLMRLYYLYEKSPKKSRKVADIVSDLKEVFNFPDGGNLPVRSQGSRWIAYKRKALQ